MTNHPPTGSQPLHREEATRSWWTNTPREGHTQRAKDEHGARMDRSAMAKRINAYTIGWSLPKSRRSL